MGEIVGGRCFRAYGIAVIGVLVGIDQHRLADGVEAAVLKGRDQVGRILIIGREQQGVAMGQGLHIRQFEGFGELRHQVGVTTGDIQRIRVVRIRDQLEKSGACYFPGGAELEFLVMLEFLAEEDRREDTQRIGVLIRHTGIEQFAGVVGALRSQPQCIAEVAEPAGVVHIGSINAVGAFVVADAEGIEDGFAGAVERVGIIVVAQVLDRGAQAGFELGSFAQWVGIVRLDGKESGGSGADGFFLGDRVDGRTDRPAEIVRGIECGGVGLYIEEGGVGGPFLATLGKHVFQPELGTVDIEYPVGIGITGGVGDGFVRGVEAVRLNLGDIGWFKSAVYFYIGRGQGRLVADKPVGADLTEHKLAFVAAEVLLQEAGGVAEVSITGGVTYRFAIHAVDHPVGGDVDLSLADIESGERVGCAMGVDTGGDVAVIAFFPVFLEDDIEDAGTAAGSIVFCGWVGDDFDAFDGIGGDFIQGQGGRAAIDKDGWRLAAEGDIAVDIYVDGRNVAHDVETGPTGADDIFFHIENFLIQFEFHRGGGGGNRYRAEVFYIFGHLDRSQIFFERGYSAVRGGIALSCRSGGSGGSGGGDDHKRQVLAFVTGAGDAHDQLGNNGQVFKIEFAAGLCFHAFDEYQFLLFCSRVDG